MTPLEERDLVIESVVVQIIFIKLILILNFWEKTKSFKIPPSSGGGGVLPMCKKIEHS